mgnify:FL=1
MTTPSLQPQAPNVNTFNQLVVILWRGAPWGYIWTPDGPERTDKDGKPYRQKVTRWQPTNRPIIVPAAWAERNVYFCVNPCTAIPTTFDNGNPARPDQVRGRMAHVGAVNCIFAEFDVKPEQYASIDAIMAQLETAPIFPTVLIHSGGGLHAYWLLEHTVLLDDTNRDHWRRLQAAWVRLVKGDAVKDLTRVLRVAGTRNMKPRFAPDFPTVKVLEADFRRVFTPWHFETATAPMLAQMEADERRTREADAERTGTAGGAADRLLSWAVKHTNEGGRHDMAIWLASKLKDEGLAQWAIASVLEDFAAQVNGDGRRKIDGKEMERIAAWATVNA